MKKLTLLILLALVSTSVYGQWIGGGIRAQGTVVESNIVVWVNNRTVKDIGVSSGVITYAWTNGTWVASNDFTITVNGSHYVTFGYPTNLGYFTVTDDVDFNDHGVSNVAFYYSMYAGDIAISADSYGAGVCAWQVGTGTYSINGSSIGARIDGTFVDMDVGINASIASHIRGYFGDNAVLSISNSVAAEIRGQGLTSVTNRIVDSQGATIAGKSTGPGADVLVSGAPGAQVFVKLDGAETVLVTGPASVTATDGPATNTHAGAAVFGEAVSQGDGTVTAENGFYEDIPGGSYHKMITGHQATQDFASVEFQAAIGTLVTNNAADIVTVSNIAASAVQDGDTLVTGLYGPSPLTTNQYATAGYVQNLTSRERTFYLWGSTASDLGGDWYFMSDGQVSDSNETTLAFAAVTQNEYTVQFATTSGVPGIVDAQAGSYDVVVYINKTGVGSASGKFEFYLLDSAGNEKFEIDDTPAEAITVTKTRHEFNIVIPTNITQLTTDRWALKHKITDVGVPAPTINFYTEGVSKGFFSGAPSGGEELDPIAQPQIDALVSTQANLVVSVGNISNDVDTAEATLAGLVTSVGNISNDVDTAEATLAALVASVGNISNDVDTAEAAIVVNAADIVTNSNLLDTAELAITANTSLNTALSNAVSTVGFSGSAADLTGNLAVARLNSGTGASAATFWRGDGSWSAPASGVTNFTANPSWRGMSIIGANTNLCTNSAFTSTGGWDVDDGGGTWTIANGIASVSGGPFENAYLKWIAPVEPGHTYYVTYTILTNAMSTANGRITVYLNSGSGVNYTNNMIGTFSELITAGSDFEPSSVAAFMIYAGGENGTYNVAVDNVSFTDVTTQRVDVTDFTWMKTRHNDVYKAYRATSAQAISAGTKTTIVWNQRRTDYPAYLVYDTTTGKHNPRHNGRYTYYGSILYTDSADDKYIYLDAYQTPTTGTETHLMHIGVQKEGVDNAERTISFSFEAVITNAPFETVHMTTEMDDAGNIQNGESNTWQIGEWKGPLQ